MNQQNIIGKKYLGRQALFTGLACLVTAGLTWFVPHFPFRKDLVPVFIIAGSGYLFFFARFGRCTGDLARVVVLLSLMGLCMLAAVVHETGGITSPLVGFYFALLVSEVGYGVATPVTVYAAVGSYLCVVLGEALGFLETSSPGAAQIYRNPAVLIFIAASVTAYMVITGRIGKIILEKLKRDFEEEQGERLKIIGKFSELDAFSQIGMLTHRIIHDLRAPLNTALGSLELKNTQGTTAKDAAELDRELADVLKSLTAKLESIAHYGRTGPEEGKENIAPAELLDTVLKLMKFLPLPYHVAVKKDYGGCDGLKVRGVKIDLQQVYFNLVKNAMEALGGAGAEKILEVKLRKTDGFAEITISDNGPGFRPLLLDILFERCITTKNDGVGVGLLITRDLLKKNGGTITIGNREGQNGAQVVTRLPLPA